MKKGMPGLALIVAEGKKKSDEDDREESEEETGGAKMRAMKTIGDELWSAVKDDDKGAWDKAWKNYCKASEY